jgi:hypothetical protein
MLGKLRNQAPGGPIISLADVKRRGLEVGQDLAHAAPKFAFLALFGVLCPFLFARRIVQCRARQGVCPAATQEPGELRVMNWAWKGAEQPDRRLHQRLPARCGWVGVDERR